MKILCTNVEEIRIAVDYMPQVPVPSEEQQPEMPMPVSPIKAQVSGYILDLVTPEFNDVSIGIGKITIYFPQMHINEIYALQNVIVVEMKIRECALVKQDKVVNKSVNKMK